MRFFTLALVSSFGALVAIAAPLSATNAPNVTRDEGIECTMATIPFALVARATDATLFEELSATGNFWGGLVDNMGEPSEEVMDRLIARSAKMVDDFDVLESEADFPAYLAPYQATFDACEEKRKAMQAG